MQLFSIAKRVLVILKCRKIILFLREAAEKDAVGEGIPSLLADRADVDLGIQITFIISYVGNENIFTSFF